MRKRLRAVGDLDASAVAKIRPGLASGAQRHGAVKPPLRGGLLLVGIQLQRALDRSFPNAMCSDNRVSPGSPGWNCLHRVRSPHRRRSHHHLRLTPATDASEGRIDRLHLTKSTGEHIGLIRGSKIGQRS